MRRLPLFQEWPFHLQTDRCRTHGQEQCR
jgi:hypothetical protein